MRFEWGLRARKTDFGAQLHELPKQTLALAIANSHVQNSCIPLLERLPERLELRVDE